MNSFELIDLEDVASFDVLVEIDPSTRNKRSIHCVYQSGLFMGFNLLNREYNLKLALSCNQSGLQNKTNIDLFQVKVITPLHTTGTGYFAVGFKYRVSKRLKKV